jgi:hypothetical protein
MHISYKTEVETPEGKKGNLEDLGVAGGMLIIWILRKERVKMSTDCNSSQGDPMRGFCEHDDEPSDSIKTWNLLTT